jgi:hypothetical protein
MAEFEKGGTVQSPERQPDKAVKMPTREQMTEKMKEGNFLGMSSQTDAFYNRFIDSVADSKKVGAGLNRVWELAKYETLRDYPPALKVLIDMDYEDVIDAVTPDPEVATRAKEARRKMLEEMKKEHGK